MNTVAILSFISVVVLATVTFIFISNTRKRIVEIKQDIKTNNLMMRNNLSKVVGDYHFNDKLLQEKTDNLDHKYSKVVGDYHFNNKLLQEKTDKLEQKYYNVFNNNDTNISINKPLKVNNMIEICDNQGNNCKQVITNHDLITLRSEKDGMRLQNNKQKNGKFKNANRQLWEKIRIEKCGVPSYGDGKNCS